MSVGKFVMTQAKSFSGMTTRNHLGAIWEQAPQMASKITTQLLQESGMKNLDSFLNSLPVKMLDTDDDFLWRLAGSSERNIPLVEARWQGAVVTDSTNNVGAGRGTFELVFAEKYFTDVHDIVGERPDTYRIKILDDPREEGTNYVYTCEVFGAEDSLLGIPGDELLPQKRFSIESALVEDELTIKGAGIQFNTPYIMRNSFSYMRVEHKVSGKMIDVKFKTNPVWFSSIVTRDPKSGKLHESTTWMQEVYWQFEQAIAKLKSKTCFFGKTNRDQNGRFLNTGKSNITIKAGSGIREQMEVSNTVFYNDFSLRIITDMLSELSEGKLDINYSSGERKFMIKTGERGLIQFHEAVTKEAMGWLSLSQNNPAVIQKTSSKYHPNSFTGGFQFTEWIAPNGVHVVVECDPSYDDKVRNKLLHPKGGVAESYRYDIFYIGSMAEPNIQKVMVKGEEELRGYQAGIRDPFTGRRGGRMERMEDSATITAMCTIGSMVKDPSRTASLIPNILS